MIVFSRENVVFGRRVSGVYQQFGVEPCEECDFPSLISQIDFVFIPVLSCLKELLLKEGHHGVCLAHQGPGIGRSDQEPQHVVVRENRGGGRVFDARRA